MSRRKGKGKRAKQHTQQNQKGGTTPTTESTLSENVEKSTVVSLDPLAPIIVGSGRPFGQAVAEPSRFPPPSTVAGCLRTAWGRTRHQSWKGLAPELAQISVTGPLLLTRKNKVLVPKPRRLPVFRAWRLSALRTCPTAPIRFWRCRSARRSATCAVDRAG